MNPARPLRGPPQPARPAASDAVAAYLARIWRYEALPREQELELARRVRLARKELVAALFASPIAVEALRSASWVLEGGELMTDESGFAATPSSEARTKLVELRERLEQYTSTSAERADGAALYAALVKTGLEHELSSWIAERHRRALSELERQASANRPVDRGRLAVMSAVQTAVVRAGRSAAEARDALLRAHLRLVVSDARRFVGRGVPLADLIQEGNLGLMAAADRFDPDMGFRFNTYAMWWIRAKLRACVAREGRTIRVPVRRLQALSRVHKAARHLSTELGREPTAVELAARCELSVSEVQSVLDVPMEPLRFEALDARGDGSPVAERLHDTDAVDPFDAVADADDETLARSLLEALDEREVRIIRKRFGFQTSEQTLEEIGKELGVTRERVRQLEARALRKMRLAAEERGHREFSGTAA